MIKYFIVFILGAIAWRIGGAGHKWVRRFILPAIITAVMWLKRRRIGIVAAFPLLILAFSLGYGEWKYNWLSIGKKFLIGCLFVLPAFIFLGFSWYRTTVPFLFVLIFWLSNNKLTSWIFRWAICEVLIGGFLGCAYV